MNFRKEWDHACLEKKNPTKKVKQQIMILVESLSSLCVSCSGRLWDGPGSEKLKEGREKKKSGKAKRARLKKKCFVAFLGSVASDFCPVVFAGYVPVHYGECKKRNPYLTSG